MAHCSKYSQNFSHLSTEASSTLADLDSSLTKSKIKQTHLMHISHPVGPKTALPVDDAPAHKNQR
jgi:hypothetical protein